MMPLAVIVMLPAIGKNDNIAGGLGTVVVAAECVALFMTVFAVERALAKKFEDF